MRVNRPRDELFAGSAFSLDEDRGLGRSGQTDEVEDFAHRLGLADDPPEAVLARKLLFQAPVLFGELPPLGPLLDGEQDFLVLEGLGNVVERALPHRLDRALDRRVGGDDDHDGVRISPADLAQDFQTRAVGEHEVQEDQVMGVRFESLERFRAGLGRSHLVAFALEKRF